MSDIRMPKLAGNATSGKIQKWAKNVGDTVQQGDPLFSMTTGDAATLVDVPSDRTGTLKSILINAGSPVHQGDVCGTFA